MRSMFDICQSTMILLLSHDQSNLGIQVQYTNVVEINNVCHVRTKLYMNNVLKNRSKYNEQHI